MSFPLCGNSVNNWLGIFGINFDCLIKYSEGNFYSAMLGI